MNVQRWIRIFAVGMLSIANMAMAQDTPWHYDFEDRSEIYQAGAGSEVSLSTRHYKSGAQSLKFAWQNNGRLLFTDPATRRNKSADGISGVGVQRAGP